MRRRAQTARVATRPPRVLRMTHPEEPAGTSRDSASGSPRDVNEQQLRPRQELPQPRIVDRSHHCLTGSGRCYQEVAVVPLLSREGDLFKEALLERLGTQLRRSEDDGRSRTTLSLGTIE